MEIKYSNEKSSTTGFVSWDRLESVLRQAGEIKPDETLVKIELTSSGMTPYIKRKRDSA